MVVRHEWTEDNDQTGRDEDRKIIVEEEIDVRGKDFGFGVERLADGGMRLSHVAGDEFGTREYFTEVILTKADLDRIKEFEQKGLI